MTKYTKETIKELIILKEQGVTHRKIAKKLFGRKSMCSTVSNLLEKYYYGNEANWGGDLKREPKILLLDIETAPAISYHWGRWKINVGTTQVIQRPYMISWSAKWLEDSPDHIMSDCISFCEDFELDPTDDTEICNTMWNLLDQADIVIGHYIKRFDIPQLYARFVVNGLPEPSPFKMICTKEIASKHFKFEANSLKELADHLELELNKNEMTFADWKNCVEGFGTPEAWAKMVEYNEIDVLVLEALYLKLRPWATNHPNISLYSGGIKPEKLCTCCGSSDLRKLPQNAYTALSEFESFRCNSCTHVMRGRTNLRDKNDMKNTLQNVTR